jgi:hypothetical protein
MIVAAFKNGSKKVFTKSAHQFDKGQKLIVTGIALPETFEVHMSNDKDGGIAYSCKGSAEGVYIPDAMFASGDYVYIWLYALSENKEGESIGYDVNQEIESIQEIEVSGTVIHEGETIYEIVVPVMRRSIQLPTVDNIIEPSSSFGYKVDDNETLIPVNSN